ncbi:hypothetical protein H0H93_012107 [Arthromyces matolae]|nr:hypothetical protein H0H93_012107 [Arthromyces matolae]
MTTPTPQPCVACVSAANSIVSLSASLRAAKEALSAAEEAMKLIAVPLPNDVAINLGYHPVDLTGIPEPFRRYCQKNDLHILQAQPTIVHARAVEIYNKHSSANIARDTPAVIPEVHHPVVDWDARLFASTLPGEKSTEPRTINPDIDPSSPSSHVSSLSTDWEREYSIDPSEMIDLSRLVDEHHITGRSKAEPNPTLSASANANGSSETVHTAILAESTPVNTSGEIFHSSADHVPPEERWYVVYAGREPGVVQGHQNRLKNIEGMSNNDSHRVVSEAVGWQFFLKGLEQGRVLQVQPVQDAKRLTIADFR